MQSAFLTRQLLCDKNTDITESQRLQPLPAVVGCVFKLEKGHSNKREVRGSHGFSIGGSLRDEEKTGRDGPIIEEEEHLFSVRSAMSSCLTRVKLKERLGLMHAEKLFTRSAAAIRGQPASNKKVKI